MSTSLASSRPHAASGAAAPSGRHGSMSSAGVLFFCHIDCYFFCHINGCACIFLDAFNTSAHAKKAKQAYARYNLPNQVLLTPLVEIPGTRYTLFGLVTLLRDHFYFNVHCTPLFTNVELHCWTSL